MKLTLANRKILMVLFVVFSVGIASSLSLLGGVGVEVVSESLLPIVPLVIVIPALNSLVGDYATLIAAHAGNPSEQKKSKKKLLYAMLPSIGVNCVFIVSMGLLLAMQQQYEVSLSFALKYTLFVVVSILLVIAAMFGLTLLMNGLLRKNKLNPDDVLIPIVTTISDIFMLGLIALSAVAYF